MDWAAVLDEKRDAILRRWCDLIIGSYPDASVAFLANQKDPFRNPMGHAIAEGIESVFEQILSGMDPDKLLAALDRIIRVRSVQEFSASEAVGFVFELKSIVRTSLDGAVSEAEHSVVSAEIDSRIDQVALLAFDQYTKCREQLNEIRLRELRGRTGKLLERANMKGTSLKPGEDEAMIMVEGQARKGGAS